MKVRATYESKDKVYVRTLLGYYEVYIELLESDMAKRIRISITKTGKFPQLL